MNGYYEAALSSLPPGAICKVAGLFVEGITRRRLLDLGFIPGAKVEVLRKSPVGDPTAYFIKGATIALRKNEADNILVSEIS
ncbi:MAG: FeoA family protein [Bacillota bacterium]